MRLRRRSLTGRRARRGAAVALLLVLAACGGDGEPGADLGAASATAPAGVTPADDRALVEGT